MGRQPASLKLGSVEDRLQEMRDLEKRIERAADLAEVKAVISDLHAILAAEIESGMW